MTNGYRLIHDELKGQRGDAVGRPCTAPGCRRLADGWGLVGDASHYGEDSVGRAVRWSNDLNDYAPLCDGHNHQLDCGGDWIYCPRGHVRVTWGTTANGRCRGCHREDARAYHAVRRDDPAYRERRRRSNQNHRAKRAVTNGQTATTKGNSE